jgi:hypothetical protein
MRSLLTITSAMLLISASTVYADTTTSPTPAPTANGAVTLLYKFVVGQDQKYQMTTTTTGTLDINGRAMPMTQTVTGDIHQVITKVDKNGDGTIAMSFDNLNMNMVVNGSAIPIPPDQVSKMMTGFSTTLSPQGKLIGMTTAAGAPAGAADTSKILSQGLSGNVAILPDHPVNIGDTWRGSMNLAALGMQTYMKMTLNGVNSLSGNNVAMVAIKTSSTINPKSGAGSSTVGQVDALGTMGFDLDNGYMRSLSEVMTIAMNITPGANSTTNTPPVGGTITLHSNVSMDLVSVTMKSLDSLSTPTATPTPAAPPATNTPVTTPPTQ